MDLLGWFKKISNNFSEQYTSTEQRVNNTYVPERELFFYVESQMLAEGRRTFACAHNNGQLIIFLSCLSWVFTFFVISNIFFH